MSELPFSLVRGSERASAVATLVSAFINDPVERWLWPDEADYATHFAELVTAMGGAAFETQTAWHMGEFAAVALWFAPGVEADGDSIVRVLIETTPAEKHDDTIAVIEAMDAVQGFRIGTCRGSVSMPQHRAEASAVSS